MSDYLTSAVLKATLSLSAETYADSDIATAITSASRAIDDECGRRFWEDPADVTRYYERTDVDLVVIDDLATLTSVKIDPDGMGTFSQAWTQNTDFMFGPENAAADGVPWTAIYRLPTSGSYLFPAGRRRIQVIGKFGWPAVPAQVVEATGIYASRLLKRAREAPFSVAGMGFDGVAIRIPKVDPDIAILLAGLHRSPVGANGMGIA